MKTIYLVSAVDYEGSAQLAAFASKDEADTYREECRKAQWAPRDKSKPWPKYPRTDIQIDGTCDIQVSEIPFYDTESQ